MVRDWLLALLLQQLLNLMLPPLCIHSWGRGINFRGLIEMGVCLSYTIHPKEKDSIRYVHGMVAALVLP